MLHISETRLDNVPLAENLRNRSDRKADTHCWHTINILSLLGLPSYEIIVVNILFRKLSYELINTNKNEMYIML